MLPFTPTKVFSFFWMCVLRLWAPNFSSARGRAEEIKQEISSKEALRRRLLHWQGQAEEISDPVLNIYYYI